MLAGLFKLTALNLTNLTYLGNYTTRKICVTLLSLVYSVRSVYLESGVLWRAQWVCHSLQGCETVRGLGLENSSRREKNFPFSTTPYSITLNHSWFSVKISRLMSNYVPILPSPEGLRICPSSEALLSQHAGDD